jgi:hypothetical protein
MKDYRKPPIYQFFKILVTRTYMPNSSSIPTLALSKRTHKPMVGLPLDEIPLGIVDDMLIAESMDEVRAGV